MFRRVYKNPLMSFLTYFNKLHGEAYKKKKLKTGLYGKLKLIILMTKMKNYVKFGKFFEKNL